MFLLQNCELSFEFRFCKVITINHMQQLVCVNDGGTFFQMDRTNIIVEQV